MKLHISLVVDSSNDVRHSGIPVVCAVCPNMNEDMILTTALVNQLQCAQASDVSLEERECNAMFNDNVVDSDSCEVHSDSAADCSQVDLATDSECLVLILLTMLIVIVTVV